MSRYKLILPLVVIILASSCRSSKKTTAVPPPPPPKPAEKPAEPPKAEAPSKLDLALLLPLELNRNLSFDTSGATETGITSLGNLQFYEGFKLAVDSLRKKGKTINVVTYDAALDSLSFINLFYKKDVLASDYIICASNANYAGAASQVAAKHNNKIVFVQSLMQNTVVKENKNSLLVLPASYSQSAKMASYLAVHYKDADFNIIYRDNGREKMWAAYFNEELKKANVKAVQSLLYSKALADSLGGRLKKGKTNVFLVPSSDEAFVSPILSKLNELNDPNIVVAGLPTWENFESIDFSAMKNIKVIYFSSTFIDESSFAVKNFQKLFFKNYHTLPLFNAYSGFDAALQVYNAHFKSENGMVPVLNYDFVQPFPGSGLENQYINIVGIENYKLVKKN